MTDDKRKRRKPEPRGQAGGRGRQARRDGWTAARREIFLDHYAENGVATEACRAAGMDGGAAYRLCRRDPEFAAQYAEAFAISRSRLEELAVLFAKTGGRAPAEPGGAPPPDLANFHPDFALSILNRARPSTAGRRSGPRPRAASKAELIETAVKLLGMLKKRRAKARLARARRAKARAAGK
ncbi:MAG: hypothetical protein QOD42_29 [Sphingomonadales bacterium]|jgi:hypothetical protein|nr:hypothetical protein [Sphingomonadales bacterium]